MVFCFVCRKIVNLAAVPEDVGGKYLQALCPIDIHYILTLQTIERDCTLQLMSIDYNQSTASSLHSLPITCDQCCNDQ